MRQSHRRPFGTRSNALWGRGGDGRRSKDSRDRVHRGPAVLLALLALSFAFVSAPGATAASTGGTAYTAFKAITVDSKVGSTGLSNMQLWPGVSQVSGYYGSVLTAPTIAVVDSGVDATRAADFGARVVAQPNFVGANASNTRPGDGFGHGTFVA